MVKKSKRSKKRISLNPVNLLRRSKDIIWQGSIWRKILSVLAVFIILFTSMSYGVAEWYIHKHNSEPFILGTSFIPDYATTFGLDPKQTLNAILGDLNIKQ